MRILYLTQWFEPEPNIIKGLAFVRALEEAGHEVTVVTGLPNYPSGKIYPGYRFGLYQRERIEGVNVVRLPLYPSHDQSALRRSLNFLSFFIAVLAYCLLQARRYDLAYVYHPPITVGFAAALAGMVVRLPYVLDVQDLWPDTVVTTGLSGASRLSRPINFMCDIVYRRARLIIAQSKGMAQALEQRGVATPKLRTIRNWAMIEEAIAVDPERLPDDRPIRLIYAGNFGKAQGLTTVVEAARRLEMQRQDIEIVLVGDGVESVAIETAAKAIPGLIVTGRVPLAEVRAHLARSDAMLLHLRDDPLFDITIPSKTQLYLASGRPIVAAIGGEAAELLKESGAAIVAQPCDPDALHDAIVRLADTSSGDRATMGRRGRAYYERNLSFHHGMTETLKALDEAAQGLARAA